MRTFGTFLAVGILALTTGCGSGGSSGSTATSTATDTTTSTSIGSGRTASNGGQCPASSGGQSCTGEAAYAACSMNACGAQYQACFGSNYASGNFTGGACAGFMTCELQCPCDSTAQTCEMNCSTQYLVTAAGVTCAACLETLSACVTAAKTPPTGTGTCAPPVCTTTPAPTSTATSTATSISTATGTNCLALQACCATIPVALASACQASLTNAAGVDTTCALIVSGFKQAGYCP